MRDGLLLERIKLLTEKAQHAIVKSVLEIVPGTEFVDYATEQNRLEICEGCDFMNERSRKCTDCKCFIDEKIRVLSFPFLEPEKCPQNKW